MTVFGYKEVRGLNVAMNNSFGMSRIEGVGDLDSQRKHGLNFQRAPHDAVLQRRTIEKLHDDERHPILLIDLVDGANVGMVQCRGGLCLALEAAERMWIFGYIIGQEFEGYEAAQLNVLGPIHHPHPAATQLLNDAVVRNGLADHWRKILRL